MNGFNIIIPLKKQAEDTLRGIASTTSIDRDSERMSKNALETMVRDIKAQGVNLFENHEHGWENTLGVIKNADLVGNSVEVDITLDEAATNPKIPALLNKLKKGIKLGLSVGGNVEGYKWEYDSKLGKKVKVLDKVKVYEISLVGIPSNADSYISIPAAIAKSARLHEETTCPLCYSKMEKQCEVCLYVE